MRKTHGNSTNSPPTTEPKDDKKRSKVRAKMATKLPPGPLKFPPTKKIKGVQDKKRPSRPSPVGPAFWGLGFRGAMEFKNVLWLGPLNFGRPRIFFVKSVLVSGTRVQNPFKTSTAWRFGGSFRGIVGPLGVAVDPLGTTLTAFLTPLGASLSCLGLLLGYFFNKTYKPELFKFFYGFLIDF